MNEAELIRRAMSVIGSKTSKRKRLASAANLKAAREDGKFGGWPKGKKRGPRKKKIS